jgi:hypothetical protein
MRHGKRRWLAWAARCLIAITGSVGCSRKTQQFERFVPDPATARAALESALTGWQKGESPRAIDGQSRDVQFVDTHRLVTQTLQHFEILGEVGSDAGRCFSVQITLANPTEEQKVRFIVIGVNPVWVFREEDLTMLTHWDHPMPPDPIEDKEKKPAIDAGSDASRVERGSD